MPFNGLGVYTPPAADFPVVTNTVISSTHFNNTINDIATALSSTLTKDGQNALTANLPGGGFRITNIGITGLNGAVGTPALNVGDAATGLYRSALNELAVTVNGTQRGRFDSTGLIVTGVGTFSGAVTVSAGGIAVTGNSTITGTLGGVTTFSASTSVTTPVIDSGSTGSLSLKTNNGTTQLSLSNAGAHVLNTSRTSSTNATALTITDTVNGAQTVGTGARIAWSSNAGAMMGILGFEVGGSGASNESQFSFYASGTNSTPAQQFQVLGTNSATRNITVTGSNGGNPTLGVTGGSLAITPNVVLGGTLTGPSSMLSPITNSLGADVLLNNTANFFDGPSVAQGTNGTWFVSGTVTVGDTAATRITAKLWDGTTVISSALVSIVSVGGSPITITLSGFITAPAGNLRISVKDLDTVNGKIIFNSSTNNHDSTITAIRIG